MRSFIELEKPEPPASKGSVILRKDAVEALVHLPYESNWGSAIIIKCSSGDISVKCIREGTQFLRTLQRKLEEAGSGTLDCDIYR